MTKQEMLLQEAKDFSMSQRARILRNRSIQETNVLHEKLRAAHANIKMLVQNVCELELIIEDYEGELE